MDGKLRIHTFIQRDMQGDIRGERGKLDETKKISDERRRKLMSHAERERERATAREKVHDDVEKRRKRWLTRKIDFSIRSARSRTCERNERVVCVILLLFFLFFFFFASIALLFFVSTHSMLEI
jgi:hypothetical protein